MHQASKTAVVVLGFFVLNQCLSLLNRWALGVKGFRFPILVTMSQALFFFFQILLGSLFSTRMRGIVSRSYTLVSGSTAEVVPVAWVGLWTSANIVLNNVSLVYISLSLNQIIRSSMPVVTAIVSSVHDGQMPSSAELVGLIVLCGGVIMVISGARTHVGDDGVFGIIMCFLGVISGAYMLYTTSKSLGRGSKHKTIQKPSSMEVAFRVAPITFLVLCPVFYIIEKEEAVEYMTKHPQESFWILVCASVVASMYNIVHTELVGHVGPVTTTVLGQVKIVSLMLLSMFVFGERKVFSMNMLWGCVLSVIGFCMYGWARMFSKPPVTNDKKES